MPLFSSILQPIVAQIANTVYARATDEELNVLMDQQDLAGQTLVVYNNLPVVTNQVSRGGFVVRDWPVQILVLQLADYDDNTVDGDTIRANCIPIADEIHDRLVQDSRYIIESYEFNFLDNEKILDKTMTGLALSFIIKFDRTAGLCQ